MISLGGSNYNSYNPYYYYNYNSGTERNIIYGLITSGILIIIFAGICLCFCVINLAVVSFRVFLPRILALLWTWFINIQFQSRVHFLIKQKMNCYCIDDANDCKVTTRQETNRGTCFAIYQKYIEINDATFESNFWFFFHLKHVYLTCISIASTNWL